MGILNPVHVLTIPTVLILTIPLAIFAGITTTLAFSVLIVRVFLVYLDLALSLVPTSLLFQIRSHPSSSSPQQQNPQNQVAKTDGANSSSSPTRRQLHHRRRRSSASAFSAGSASSSIVGERGLGLIPSVGAERDFEGIGGWRVGGEEEDELWNTVNMRLDMPERSSPFAAASRQHHRTPSGGPGVTTPGEGGYLMMKGRTRSPEASGGGGGGGALKTASTSPNSSRARTPTGPRLTFTTGAGPVEGYFAPRNTSPKATKKV